MEHYWDNSVNYSHHFAPPPPPPFFFFFFFFFWLFVCLPILTFCTLKQAQNKTVDTSFSSPYNLIILTTEERDTKLNRWYTLTLRYSLSKPKVPWSPVNITGFVSCFPPSCNIILKHKKSKATSVFTFLHFRSFIRLFPPQWTNIFYRFHQSFGLSPYLPQEQSLTSNLSTSFSIFFLLQKWKENMKRNYVLMKYLFKGTSHDSIFQFSLFSTLADFFAV